MRRIREASAANGRPAVKVGQIWRDRTRDDKGRRYLRVIAIEEIDGEGRAIMEHVRQTTRGWQTLQRPVYVKLYGDSTPKSHRFVLHAEAE